MPRRFFCCRCGYGKGDMSYIPIDPKGSALRRWVCTRCASEKEVADAKANLGDALKVAQDINPEFLK